MIQTELNKKIKATKISEKEVEYQCIHCQKKVRVRRGQDVRVQMVYNPGQEEPYVVTGGICEECHDVKDHLQGRVSLQSAHYCVNDQTDNTPPKPAVDDNRN